MDTLRIKFWGTRGIIPSPRDSTKEFGGNTSCIQILYKDHIIIVDTGHGVALLGEELQSRLHNKENLKVHIFYTHFHWDHILGLPFFHPIYYPSASLNLYSPTPEKEIWENLDILFDGSYSPFSGIKNMPSKVLCKELKQTLQIDDLQIDFTPVEHFIHGNQRKDSHTYAYRFRTKDHSLVIAVDHEAKKCAVNDALISFAKGADILVHDAQFTEEDALVGWGHSTVKQALENAKKMEVGLTLLTHHDPERDDEDIRRIHLQFKKSKDFGSLNFEFAREGVVYE